MGYSRFWLKMADVESKSIPHELPSSHWLKATGHCVLERYLSATMTGNANRTLGYIRRNIKTKNQKVRETAYNTLVRSQLEYSAPVWDPSSKDKRNQLEKIQRRAARWTTSNYDTRSSVSAMLNQLGWRTLEQRRADARLCLFYKIVYGLVAVPLPNYVQPTHRVSRYCHSMTYRQILFFPLAIVQWNALPEAVASLPDLNLFKVAVSKLQHTRP